MNLDFFYHALGNDLKDETLFSLIDRLHHYSSSNHVVEFLHTQSKMGVIEECSPNNYRYGEYTFIRLRQFGQEYVNALNIVNELGLSIFPKLIKAFEYDDGGMVVFIKIPGNIGEDIKWGQCDVYDLPESAKQKAVDDLKKLEEAGYLLLPQFRFSVGVTPNGHVMIPDIPLVRKEDAQNIIGDIYSRYSMFGWKKAYTAMPR